MKYIKNYCEEKGISTSKLNEAQRTLYYIAENMKLDRSISEEGYKHFQMAIKALEQEPYEKFKSAKDHICKLAGDYKCWDNRLTSDEALELCHILEQESVLDKIKGYVDHIRNTGMGKKKSLEFIEKFIEGLKAESEG